MPREYGGHVIHQRCRDGYVNATAMAAACGGRLDNYMRSPQTRAFLDALARSLNLSERDLLEARQGGTPSEQGTWVHPQVAIHLAQWLSPAFAVQVTAWVLEILAPVAVPTLLQPYSRRVHDAFLTMRQVPLDYWTVFEECASFLVIAESAFQAIGVEMDELDLLDGSIGQHWARFREGKDWCGERIRYPHRFPAGDPRGTQLAWAYPMGELQEFRAWMHSVYPQDHFGCYLDRRYGAGTTDRALPVFQRRGLQVSRARLPG